jgi:hypothetical protein
MNKKYNVAIRGYGAYSFSTKKDRADFVKEVKKRNKKVQYALQG